VRFDFKPDAELVVRLPDFRHGGPGVTRDHVATCCDL